MPESPEVIHRAVDPLPAGSLSYATRARCGPARFEGGYTEPMLVTCRRRNVTCLRCRRARRDMVAEQAILAFLLAATLVVGVVELAYVRVQRVLRPSRAEPSYGRPGADT